MNAGRPCTKREDKRNLAISKQAKENFELLKAEELTLRRQKLNHSELLNKIVDFYRRINRP